MWRLKVNCSTGFCWARESRILVSVEYKKIHLLYVLKVRHKGQSRTNTSAFGVPFWHFLNVSRKARQEPAIGSVNQTSRWVRSQRVWTAEVINLQRECQGKWSVLSPKTSRDMLRNWWEALGAGAEPLVLLMFSSWVCDTQKVWLQHLMAF